MLQSNYTIFEILKKWSGYGLTGLLPLALLLYVGNIHSIICMQQTESKKSDELQKKMEELQDIIQYQTITMDKMKREMESDKLISKVGVVKELH